MPAEKYWVSKSTDTKPLSPRVAAAEVVAHVLRGQSLSALLPNYANRVPEKDRSLFKEICFGSLRWYPQIALLIKRLVEKPLREKDLEIQGLIASGIYQLMYMRTSEHAVVNETVAATKGLNRVWAKGLVNAVLRTFQREKASLLHEKLDNNVFQTAHPKWLLEKLEQAWSPTLAAKIVAGNNERGPMTLRVNTLRQSRDAYLEQLKISGIIAEVTQYSTAGITLAAAVDILQLPGFENGEISVQDEAAQLAASLLLLEPNQVVLDACCAPGGKTCHILETEPGIKSLLAIDSESRRLLKVEENLNRLKLKADLKTADAGDIDIWWDKTPFDRILLDAPC